MIIRAATPEDAAAICDISNPLIRDTLITFTTVLRREEDTRAAIRASDGAFLVAEEAGRVIGFASFAPFRAGPGYAQTKENSIQLAPSARGRGTGRALMAALEQVAKDQGIHILVAGISSANPGAVAFHRRLGFAEVGRMPEVGRKADQWLDLVLMQKRL